MLTKITSKNQISIPKSIMEQLHGVKYFDLAWKDGTVILRPLKENTTDLDNIRSKIRKIGLTPKTVDEAVQWARSKFEEKKDRRLL